MAIPKLRDPSNMYIFINGHYQNMCKAFKKSYDNLFSNAMGQQSNSNSHIIQVSRYIADFQIMK